MRSWSKCSNRRSRCLQASTAVMRFASRPRRRVCQRAAAQAEGLVDQGCETPGSGFQALEVLSPAIFPAVISFPGEGALDSKPGCHRQGCYTEFCRQAANQRNVPSIPSHGHPPEEAGQNVRWNEISAGCFLREPLDLGPCRIIPRLSDGGLSSPPTDSAMCVSSSRRVRVARPARFPWCFADGRQQKIQRRRPPTWFNGTLGN